MQAVILAGGMGTRLQGLHPDVPKALAPVLGRPFLDRQIEWLARGGIRDFHLAAGHRAEEIRQWIETGFEGDLRRRLPGAPLELTLSVEPAPLGTAGGLRFAGPWLRSDPFLAVNGDTLLPGLDFQALEELGRRLEGPWLVLAVARIEDAGRYGTVLLDERGRIAGFREKSGGGAGWVNGGVYLLRREVLEGIPRGAASSAERDLFPDLCRRGRLHAFPVPPPLLDMGTPEGIRDMEKYLSSPHRKGIL